MPRIPWELYHSKPKFSFPFKQTILIYLYMDVHFTVINRKVTYFYIYTDAHFAVNHKVTESPLYKEMCISHFINRKVADSHIYTNVHFAVN